MVVGDGVAGHFLVHAGGGGLALLLDMGLGPRLGRGGGEALTRRFTTTDSLVSMKAEEVVHLLLVGVRGLL